MFDTTFFHIYFTKPKQKYNGVLNNTNPRLIYRSYSTGRLTNAQRESFLVSPDLHEILIGISLRDFHILNHPKGKNANLVFTQGLVNKDYINNLFELFSSYSNMKEPKLHEYFDKKLEKYILLLFLVLTLYLVLTFTINYS